MGFLIEKKNLAKKLKRMGLVFLLLNYRVSPAREEGKKKTHFCFGMLAKPARIWCGVYGVEILYVPLTSRATLLDSVDFHPNIQKKKKFATSSTRQAKLG